MAKWGEGDPRWIVEERPDATNVNNWHWSEKDATNWSKSKLKELFVGLKVEVDAGACEITELTKTEGEASVYMRKGKLNFFYDWVLVGSWEGKLSDGQKKIKGKFEVPNLGEENSADEVDMTVSTDKETDEARAVKEIMRVNGLKVVRQQIEKYMTQLKQEYSQGIILPSKHTNAAATVEKNNKENVAKQELNKVVPSPSSSKSTGSNVGVRIPTSTITMKETFQCPAASLYRALVDKEMVRSYAGSDSVIEAATGERFVLMGGNILGEFTQLVPDRKVCMRWRMKSWPEEHYSNVTIDLEEKGADTVLSMKQTGVPEREQDKTQEGWKFNFWERMRIQFGFGARLF